MLIQSKMEGETMVVLPEGRLNTVNAPQLESYLSERYGEANNMILDCANMEYISSAGLRILMKSYKAMTAKNGKFLLRNVTAQVKETLELTGYVHVLTII